MTLEVRAATADQVAEFRGVLSKAFGWDPPAEREASFARLWEPERSFCAFDGEAMVGTSGAFSLEMTVPGGSVATGGTTMIGVLPTHRRHGALRQMIMAHLADVADHNEPIAALWASDSAIYGRFGYGMASVHHEVTIDPRHAAFHRLAPSPIEVRFVEAEEARRRLPPIHDRLRPLYPGFYRRSEPWWEERWFADPSTNRGGATALRFAVTNDDSGYMIYRQKNRWEEGHGAGEVRVLDLMAATPQGWAGLWRLALSHDLTTKVTADLRPPHDPLFDLLAARRRAISRVSDALWVRLLDLPKALSARRYQMEGRLVLAVVDRFLDKTTVVELIAGRDGADCRVSTAEPQIEIDLEDLGGSYMGRARFQELAITGRVKGGASHLRTADLMFGWSPPPWCPEVF